MAQGPYYTFSSVSLLLFQEFWEQLTCFLVTFSSEYLLGLDQFNLQIFSLFCEDYKLNQTSSLAHAEPNFQFPIKSFLAPVSQYQSSIEVMSFLPVVSNKLNFVSSTGCVCDVCGPRIWSHLPSHRTQAFFFVHMHISLIYDICISS